MRKLRNTFPVSFFSSQRDSERESRQEFRWLPSHGSHALHIFGFEMMLCSASFPRLAMAVGRGKMREECFEVFSIHSEKLWSDLLVLQDAVALCLLPSEASEAVCLDAHSPLWSLPNRNEF